MQWSALQSKDAKGWLRNEMKIGAKAYAQIRNYLHNKRHAVNNKAKILQ